MLDCTTDSYATLYARWLEKPGALLDWGGYDPQKHTLLDLCGGTGAVSCAALARGGVPTLFDLNPRCTDQRVRCVHGRAEDIDAKCLYYGWDFIVCRQAICYLNLYRTARALYEATAPGAIFVCNAFVKPKWDLKSYEFGGRRYVEASGFFGTRVFHLQAMRGDFDVTAFRWYTEDEIRSAFATYWTLEKLDVSDKSMKFAFRRKA
jgi:hypothetical protein